MVMPHYDNPDRMYYETFYAGRKIEEASKGHFHGWSSKNNVSRSECSIRVVECFYVSNMELADVNFLMSPVYKDVTKDKNKDIEKRLKL